MDILIKMMSSANNFFDAASRCDFPKEEVTDKNYPLLIPEFVNRAFACELYLKLIAIATSVKVKNKHQLDYLFNHLNIEDQNKIFNIWLEIAGENLYDCDYTRKMFQDNLLSISDVFERFRYTHEWVGSVVSIPSSYKRPEQFDLAFKGHVHSGFLKSFALVLQKHIYTEYLKEGIHQLW